MSSAQTTRIAKDEADANRRRDVQDRQRQISNAHHAPGSVASLRSKKLISEESPRLVLWYRKYDQFCLSEITMVAAESGNGLEPMFTMVCTTCLSRGVPQGQAQLQVRNSNRAFSIDNTQRGPKQVQFADTMTVVEQCGTVTVEEAIRCGDCGQRYRVVDSKVEEV